LIHRNGQPGGLIAELLLDVAVWQGSRLLLVLTHDGRRIDLGHPSAACVSKRNVRENHY
jgi:hypothetical protein